MPNARTYIGAGVRLVYSIVVSNIGDAYNDNTGIFTAPFNGTYSFAVTTMPSNNGYHYTVVTVNGDLNVQPIHQLLLFQVNINQMYCLRFANQF